MQESCPPSYLQGLTHSSCSGTMNIFLKFTVFMLCKQKNLELEDILRYFQMTLLQPRMTMFHEVTQQEPVLKKQNSKSSLSEVSVQNYF
jgi:hypothetical protein